MAGNVTIEVKTSGFLELWWGLTQVIARLGGRVVFRPDLAAWPRRLSVLVKEEA